MAELKAIRGGKPREMAQGWILECRDCPKLPPGTSCRKLRETRVGVIKGKHGRIIHRGTLVYVCDLCGRSVE